MPNLGKVAKDGDKRALYEALLVDLAETLDDGAGAYTKAGIVKQIICLCDKLDALPNSNPDSPLARAKRRAAAERALLDDAGAPDGE